MTLKNRVRRMGQVTCPSLSQAVPNLIWDTQPIAVVEVTGVKQPI